MYFPYGNMWALLFVALAVFLVAEGQAPSAECMNRPSVRPDQCCAAAPKFMTPELAEECGLPAKMADQNGNRHEGGRRGPPPCEAVQCLLKKNNLLTSDNKVNVPALKTFMESQYSSSWKSAIDKSIQKCNTDVAADTSDDCEVRRYVHCFKHQMMMNCPADVWVSSAECAEMKTHMEKCPMPPMRRN